MPLVYVTEERLRKGHKIHLTWEKIAKRTYSWVRIQLHYVWGARISFTCAYSTILLWPETWISVYGVFNFSVCKYSANAAFTGPVAYYNMLWFDLVRTGAEISSTFSSLSRSVTTSCVYRWWNCGVSDTKCIRIVKYVILFIPLYCKLCNVQKLSSVCLA